LFILGHKLPEKSVCLFIFAHRPLRAQAFWRRARAQLIKVRPPPLELLFRCSSTRSTLPNDAKTVLLIRAARLFVLSKAPTRNSQIFGTPRNIFHALFMLFFSDKKDQKTHIF
jgi:hypothetical protein